MQHGGNHIALATVRGISELSSLSTADRQKPTIVVEDVVSTDWASATFIGATHEIALQILGNDDAVAAAVATISAGLPDHEFTIAGHIVAEIAVLPGCEAAVADHMISKSLTVNALTISD